MNEDNNILMELEKLLDKKLSALATKEDLNDILNELVHLRSENRELKKEIKNLNAQNKLVWSRLNDLENRNRRNNLIFKGLKYRENDNAIDIVKNFCVNNLGARSEIGINRAHPLGKNKIDAPLIAHFPNDCDINFVLKNTKKLKGTNIFVHRDFCIDTRKKRAKHFIIKKEIKKFAADKRVAVVQDKLIIEGEVFTWEDEKLVTGDEEGFEQLSRILRRDVTYLEERIANQSRKNSN